MVKTVHLSQLLADILDRSIALLQADGGGIYLHDAKTNSLRWTLVSGENMPPIGTKLAYGEGLSGRAWAQQKTLFIDDYDTWENRSSRFDPYQLKAIIAAPIIWQDEFIGVLNLMHRTLHKFSQTDANQLTLFAQQAALTVHNARLYKLAQKEVEDHKATQQRFKALIEHNSDVLAILNSKARFTYVSPAIESAFGYTPNELLGVSGYQLLHPDEQDVICTLLTEIAQTADASFTRIVRLRHKNGSWQWAEGTVKNLHHMPSIQGFTATFHNITLRHELEDRLLEAKTRYQIVAELTSDFTYAIAINPDFTAYVEWLTPAFTTITGYGPDEISAASDLATLCHPDDTPRILQHCQSLLAGQPDTAVIRIITKTGTIRWLRNYSQPVFDETNGRIIKIYGAAKDITEQRQAEEAMNQTQRLESLGILAGSIAHDFNNLLTSILTQTSLANHYLTNDSPARHYLHTALKAIERASDLTNQLLVYSGKGQQELKRIDMNQLVDDNMVLLHAILPGQITLYTQLATSALFVEAEQGQIQQVVMNLIINGAEAYEGQSGTVQVHTCHIAWPPNSTTAVLPPLPPCLAKDPPPAGDYVGLCVQDQGKGMDEATVQKIFDPFFTTKIKGRGLGLATVRNIVQAHQGYLYVQSSPEQGTSFLLLLPAATPEPDMNNTVEPIDPLETAVGPAATAKGTILVIDDEYTLRVAFKDMLQLEGFNVLLAEDGAVGLALFAQHADTISLVLLDITVPAVSGEQVFKELRQQAPTLPILLMSGYSEKEAVRQLTGEADFHFLKKPFHLTDFRQKIYALLPS